MLRSYYIFYLFEIFLHLSITDHTIQHLPRDVSKWKSGDGMKEIKNRKQQLVAMQKYKETHLGFQCENDDV